MAFEYIVPLTNREMSQRKLEVFDKYSKVIDWGRINPADFMKRFMGYEMIDFQRYVFENTWLANSSLWVMCRNGSKTTVASMYIMTRSILLPKHSTYILGNTGDQSKEVYMKIEKLAKKEIESYVGSTEFFFEELEKNGTTSDGFTHAPNSYKSKLYNGSEINTLNSDITNIKGKRANLVFFDEAGWINDELFIQGENFANQSQEFKLGTGFKLDLEPKAFPRQIIYASSASDIESEFYKKYKNYAMKMLLGDTRYFVFNFDVDNVAAATFNGEPYPSLINPDVIQRQLDDDYDKARRELYNEFSADSFDGQIVTRADIQKVTTTNLPLLSNDTGDRQFVLVWDSARINDNSNILIAELIDDPEMGWTANISNLVNLVDVDTKKGMPMKMPEQVREFKDLLITYNGNDKRKLDYENINQVLCDAGAGGQMIGGITDYLLEDWVDKHGQAHAGLIDTSHKAYESAKKKYKNAKDIITLVDPKGKRNEIMDAAEKMTKLGVIKFPIEYTYKPQVERFTEDGKIEIIELSVEEQLSLNQIELLKKELVTMCKFVTSGNVKYDFPADKRNRMHDDRMFTYALLCWHLKNLRHGQIVKKPKESIDSHKIISLTRKPTIYR